MIVSLVHTNVPNVPIQTDAFVLKTESTNQIVIVKMDSMMPVMPNVNHVKISVPLVLIMIIVLLVPKTESVNQNVVAHTDIGITTKPNVTSVVTCAKPVKPKNTVGPVLKTESVHHPVTVQTTGSIPPPTTVTNVHTNVNNVPVLNPIVVLVPLTESMPQLVLVQLELMIFRVNQPVNLVIQNVLLVLTMMFVYPLVLVTE